MISLNTLAFFDWLSGLHDIAVTTPSYAPGVFITYNTVLVHNCYYLNMAETITHFIFSCNQFH